MLGTTARKLRILGYDTLYDPESDDKELLRIARESGRILVTSDSELFLNAKRLNAPAVLTTERSEAKRLYEVLAKNGIRSIIDSKGHYPQSRCSVCNGELENVGSSLVSETSIFVCKSCGKHYWKGSHWKKLDALFREVSLLLGSDTGTKLGERVQN